MRKRKKSEEGGFNVWRSYSDMMAGVLLLFILIMCVTLFQAQKSYNESIKERDDKIALQEQYTAEILAQQSELDEKNSKLSSQDEQLDKQKKLLAELAAQLKEQQASLDEKTSLLATQQKKIDNIIGVKADVIEALQKEFSKNNVSVDIDAQTGALTLNANVLFDYDKSELTDEGKQELADILPIYCKVLLQKDYKLICRFQSVLHKYGCLPCRKCLKAPRRYYFHQAKIRNSLNHCRYRQKRYTA